MSDICSICDGVYEDNSLYDIENTEFELICCECAKKQFKTAKELSEVVKTLINPNAPSHTWKHDIKYAKKILKQAEKAGI